MGNPIADQIAKQKVGAAHRIAYQKTAQKLKSGSDTTDVGRSYSRVIIYLIKPYIAERLCTPVTCLRVSTDCLGKSGLGLDAQRKAVAVPMAGTVMCGSGLELTVDGCGWQEMRDVYRSPKPVPFATPPCANLLNKIRSYRRGGLRIIGGVLAGTRAGRRPSAGTVSRMATIRGD